jgi:hypothetical protein
LSFQLESLNILRDGILMGPMWNDYNKLSAYFDNLLVKIPSYLMEVA